MANPQVENGHLKVANEVWDHLMSAELTGAEFRIAFAVIRKTWGWKRKEHEVSLAEFMAMTDLPHRTVANAMVSLLAKNILTQARGGGRSRPSTWSFNKDWESWNLCHPRHSKINCAKINTVLNGTQSVPPVAQNMVINGTVSPGNLFDLQGNEPPKATFKAIKANIGAKAPSRQPRKPDPAYETFCSEFVEHRGIPYRSKKPDFIHLADLRKSLQCNNGDEPRDWSAAIHNYFASPQGKYTLADLCNRFDVFRLGRLDRYGKPEIKNADKRRSQSDELALLFEEGKI